MESNFIYIPPKTDYKLVDIKHPWLGKVFSTKQPERLNEKTYYRNEDGTYPHLEPVIGSDSLN